MKLVLLLFLCFPCLAFEFTKDKYGNNCRWPEKTIKYQVCAELKDVTKKALDIWVKECGFKFVESDDPELTINLKEMKAPDLGESRIAASNGIIHHAVINVSPNIKGKKLLKVLLHELGHTLGLDHSEDPCSIMREYIEDVPDAKLYIDDISAIKKLYE